MNSARYLLFWFFISGFLSIKAQENFFRHFSTNEGLPSSETYSVFQDSKGYIWVATDMGVSRFDGYNFKNYTTADGLVDNAIFAFYEDSAGRIWFHSFSGKLSFFYNDTIYGKDFPLNQHIRDFISSGYLTGIRSDSKDTLWLSTLNGLLKVPPDTKNGGRTWSRIEKLNSPITFLGNSKNDFVTIEPVQGKTLALTVYRKTKLVKRNIIPESFFRAYNVVQGFDNNYTMYCADSVLLLNSSGQIAGRINQSQVVSSLREYDSLLWMGSKVLGVWLYDLSDLRKPLKHFLQGLTVSCIMRDKENGYWFTTTEDGLFYLSSVKLTHYTKDLNLKPADKITSLTPVPGSNEIWITAYKTLLTVNELSGPRFQTLKKPAFPPHQDIYFWNTFFSKPNELLLSTSSGVARVNASTHEFLSYVNMFGDESGLEYDSRTLAMDSKGGVWSLNLAVLRKIDPVSGEILKEVSVPARAQTICEDFYGNMLVGTIDGMYCYKNDSLFSLGAQNPIYKNRFVDIKKQNDVIAAATRGAGLFIFKGDSVYHLDPSNGLLSSMCRSLYIDDQNTIWLATNRGLNRIKLTYTPFKAVISELTIADGLLSNDIDLVTRSKDYVWLYSKKGLTAFNPDSVLINNYAPPVYITQLTIDNIPVSIKQANALSYATNFIGISFIGLTYKTPGKQIYQYRLEGYDSTWAVTTTPFVQFTKLPPGDYKFLVKCVNNSGVESLVPASFAFTITTPFYRKWWFSALLMFFSIVIVITGAVYAVNRIRRREEEKTEVNRKMANLELHALRAQMNPHFIFNCLNAIQDFIVKNDAQSARRYLTSFAKLIRITLNNSHKQYVPLNEEIDFLRLYLNLEQMRFKNKFDYSIEQLAGISDTVEVPSMILQPFVENAIRHGRIGSLEKQGQLNVRFEEENNNLVCIVEDNGIGVNKATQTDHLPGSKQTHALDIINDRVKTINDVNRIHIRYTIEDRSDLDPNATGTIVKLIIPLK